MMSINGFGRSIQLLAQRQLVTSPMLPLLAPAGVRLEALMSGGGQERGLRSGTVPTPLVVGLGAACDVARKVGHMVWL